MSVCKTTQKDSKIAISIQRKKILNVALIIKCCSKRLAFATTDKNILNNKNAGLDKNILKTASMTMWQHYNYTDYVIQKYCLLLIEIKYTRQAKTLVIEQLVVWTEFR